MMKRFFDKIKKTDNCWLWTAGKNKDGYGKFNIGGKTIGAHRVSYSINVGEIPKGLCVLHKCDNPMCVNPDHLWIGTVKDNNTDRSKKGRDSDRRGEKCPTAKLTQREVSKIRAMYLTGEYTQRKIANLFSIGQQQVSRIIRKERWL